MKVSKEVKNLSDEIARRAMLEADYLPIDRKFLEKNYLSKILSVGRLEFLLYNLENVNNTYTVQLFKCLPEMWRDMTYEELVELINNFSNTFSFYALIQFTYKYLGIDLIGTVLDSPHIKNRFKRGLIEFLLGQVGNLIDDDEELKEAFENVGVTLDDWRNIKQKLLLDIRLAPTTKSKHELYQRLTLLNGKFID